MKVVKPVTDGLLRACSNATGDEFVKRYNCLLYIFNKFSKNEEVSMAKLLNIDNFDDACLNNGVQSADMKLEDNVPIPKTIIQGRLRGFNDTTVSLKKK